MPKHITLMALMSLMTVTLAAASGGGTVYKSLGGKKAIVAVVDGFAARVAADNRIDAYFKETASDPARLAKFKPLRNWRVGNGELLSQFAPEHAAGIGNHRSIVFAKGRTRMFTFVSRGFLRTVRRRRVVRNRPHYPSSLRIGKLR